MPGLRAKLFVSSPFDVKPERDRVVAIVDRINSTFESLVRIDVIRWEDDFYNSTRPFQEQIDDAVSRMAEVDIFICILWGRIGLKLNPRVWKRDEQMEYESGTVYEYESAVALSKRNDGVPDVYLFRKSAGILYRPNQAADDVNQYKALDAVWQRWTQSPEGYNAAGYQMFSDTDDFERQLEGCLMRWLERKGIVFKDAVWDRRLKGSPFRGLAAFEPSHSSVFCGRDAAIASIVAKLRTTRFLLLIGGSGTGKSSLLRAGLIPRILKPGIIPGIDLWCPALIAPNKDPFLDLAQSLFAESCLKANIEEVCGSVEDLASLMRSGDPGLEAIRLLLESAAQRRAKDRNYTGLRPSRILLAIDQFERLFVEAQPDDVSSFARFVQLLVSNDLAYVIVALRSDSYGSFQSVHGFLSLREGGSMHDLLPPNILELEEIVTRPVLACFPPLNFEIDSNGNSLASTLVNDAKGGDSLPLLQMTLEHLFQAEKERGDGVLSFSDYGGIEQAVIKAASDAFSELDETARSCLPALITSLVHDVSLDTANAKRVITLQPIQLGVFERDRPERAALVAAFVAHRLLTAEEVAGETQVRAVHEALLRVWPEATKTLTENESIIRVRHTIEPLVAQWVESRKAPDSDFLLTSPALLAGVRQLTERIGDDLPREMRDFIAASLAAENERAERESRQRTAILSATGKMRARSIPYYRLIVGTLLALAVLVRFAEPSVVEWLGFLAFDTFQQISPREKLIRPVTIVDIDEKSLSEFGQWPWPRTLMADLVTRLTNLGAVAIGFDVVFPEPDKMSPALLAKEVQGLDNETRSKLSELPSNDKIFADAIKRSRVIVAEGAQTVPDNRTDDQTPEDNLVFIGGDPNKFLYSYPGRLSNIPIIEQAASGHGVITIIPERDNILRRVPALLRVGRAWSLSLPVEMLRVITGTQRTLVRLNEAGLEGISLRGLDIPTDDHGQIWIHFGHPDPSIYISAVDVLSNRARRDKIQGKLVIIGSSALGLGDIKQTPLGVLTGAEVHAQLIENILTGSTLERPTYGLLVEICSIILIGGIFALLMPVFSAWILSAVSVLTLAIVLMGSWALFRYWQLLINPVYPLITTATLITVLTFVIYRHSESQRGTIRTFFDRKSSTNQSVLPS